MITSVLHWTDVFVFLQVSGNAEKKEEEKSHEKVWLKGSQCRSGGFSFPLQRVRDYGFEKLSGRQRCVSETIRRNHYVNDYE